MPCCTGMHRELPDVRISIDDLDADKPYGRITCHQHDSGRIEMVLLLRRVEGPDADIEEHGVGCLLDRAEHLEFIGTGDADRPSRWAAPVTTGPGEALTLPSPGLGGGEKQSSSQPNAGLGRAEGDCTSLSIEVRCGTLVCRVPPPCTLSSLVPFPKYRGA